MKKYLFLLLSTLLIASCDAPQRTRAPVNYMTGDGLTSPGSGGFTGPDPGTTPGTTTGSTNGGTTGTGEPGFESCNLTDRYHSVAIGHFGICQSSQDETVFKLRTSLSSTGERVCLIPTYVDSAGKSTYLGQPQCAYTEANKVIQGKLYKNRSGFGDRPLNGVIVMKEGLLNPYFNCMNAFIKWPANACPNGPATSQYCNYWVPTCPYGPSANGTCSSAASTYMGQVCESFKSSFGNSYVDIKTR